MKPNILFLLTDDQRFNTIHALGNDEIITPNMDALVNSGTAFTHAHIPGGTCGAVCMPSRAMIHTGRTLFHIDREGQEISPEYTTLGETLKKSGYYCYGIGKWHNGCKAYNRSFDQGDNIYFGGMWDHWNVPTCRYDPTGEYNHEIHYTPNFFQDNHPIRRKCDKLNQGIHSSQLLSDTAISFIDDYSGEKPFFLYTAYLAPHDPRTMPEKFKKMYDPEKIKIPENFQEQHFEFGISQIRDETLAPYPRTEKEIKRHIAEYYGMITHLDYEIGRIIETLKRNGQYENTIIVLTGDNGLAVGNHGLMGKQNNYEHSIRVPLIISGPGIPKGQIRDQYVYLLDIYPTLCDLLDIEIPKSVDGKSFKKCIEDKEYETRKDLYFAYGEFVRSVKDKNCKLITYRNCADTMQLFDLNKDPMELNNLIDDPSYKDEKEHLLQLLQEYRVSWDDEKHPLGKLFWSANQE